MRIFLALILAALAAAPARCAWKDISAADFTIGPPPAPGSAENAKDLADILRLQEKRDARDCALARTQTAPDFRALYDGSGILSAHEMTLVADLMNQLLTLTTRVVAVYKKRFARPRPYNEDLRIHPCADKPGGAKSYPSTHAAAAAVDACVLGRLFPARARALATYGDYLGDLRVIVGVHHPTDVAASRDLAAQICARLLQETDFLDDLQRVKNSLP